MDRVAVVRVTLLGALAALAACADAPVAPAALAPRARPAFEANDGNPPPPPADGFADGTGGGGTGCVLPPSGPAVCERTLRMGGVQGTILVNPPATVAFLQIASVVPSIVVSPQARVQQTETGLVGRGTIEIPLGLITGVPGSTGIVHLADVTGWIISPLPPGARKATIVARLTYPDGSDVIVSRGSGPADWYRYVEMVFTY